MESKLSKRFDTELKYKIQSKFPMTSRLPIFNLQKLNLQANIPFDFLFYYLIIEIFPAKILKGNKSELNRKFNRRFHPGLKPAFFDFLPIFSKFPIFSPQNKNLAAFFWGGGRFLI